MPHISCTEITIDRGLILKKREPTGEVVSQVEIELVKCRTVTNSDVIDLVGNIDVAYRGCKQVSLYSVLYVAEISTAFTIPIYINRLVLD